VGPHLIVDVHIQVNGALSVAEGHQIAHQGQDAVLSKVEEVSEVIVHVEPDTAIFLPDIEGR
jgi:divalent metal cation (Fe/Co/Zn/Cd) transporter